VPGGVVEAPFLDALDVEELALGEEVEALVVVFCEELVAPVVDDVPDAAVVFMAVFTAKPCCWNCEISR
jgi:hypothetical protein